MVPRSGGRCKYPTDLRLTKSEENFAGLFGIRNAASPATNGGLRPLLKEVPALAERFQPALPVFTQFEVRVVR